jgi:hypothetical protein
VSTPGLELRQRSAALFDRPRHQFPADPPDDLPAPSMEKPRAIDPRIDVVPPSRALFSTRSVLAPERLDWIAATTPAEPPPMTKTSKDCFRELEGLIQWRRNS